ncbi:MAG: enoyl-CoA hydratase/isomerase family protein, partial [Thermodesulfobacteriota bacterium]
MNNHNELQIESRNGICKIIINRPEKRNSLTPSILNALQFQIEKLKKDKGIRCIVITGAGDKAFSSGFDINSIGENDMLRDYDKNDPLINVMKAIEKYPYPVISMINGHAFGAALELAATCDIRICVDTAILGMPPAKLGVVYSYSGIKKFINLIGLGNTKELFLIGKTIDAEKAKNIGFINHLSSKNDLEKTTYDLASQIVENAPLSLRTMKKMINSWQNSHTLNTKDEEEIRTLLKKVQESSDYK